MSMLPQIGWRGRWPYRKLNSLPWWYVYWVSSKLEIRWKKSALWKFAVLFFKGVLLSVCAAIIYKAGNGWTTARPTLWHDPVRTIMGVQKDVQPWRSQDPTFFQHGGKLFVWGLLAFSRISDKPKIVDLMLVAHYGESPSLRPMSAVRSEWPHVPDARKVVLVDAVSGHRATLWQVRGHLPMPTDGPSTTTVAAMV